MLQVEHPKIILTFLNYALRTVTKDAHLIWKSKKQSLGICE